MQEVIKIPVSKLWNAGQRLSQAYRGVKASNSFFPPEGFSATIKDIGQKLEFRRTEVIACYSGPKGIAGFGSAKFQAKTGELALGFYLYDLKDKPFVVARVTYVVLSDERTFRSLTLRADKPVNYTSVAHAKQGARCITDFFEIVTRLTER